MISEEKKSSSHMRVRVLRSYETDNAVQQGPGWFARAFQIFVEI